MNMNYKICFVCTGNACRSPFAECVTKKLLADAGMNGIEVFSLGTLDCGEYPRDAAMVDVAKELGYDLSGTTTVMTREKLMAADAVIVFDERHRDAITRVLDYSYWNKIVLFNKMAFDEDGNMFVPERNNHIIRKITPAGSASLYAGQPEQSGFGDGLPEEAKFNQPECVTVYPDNSVYVADRDNHVIRRVTVE
mgnify:CR=1 FL=1